MKIAIVIGSRADSPGIIAIANALAERGIDITVHTVHPIYQDNGEHMPAFIPDWLQGAFPHEPFDGWGCGSFFWRSSTPWKGGPDCPDAVVLLGDRYEIAEATLEYRQAQIPIAHIHAGEITGQEPDDTYRDVISRMATWCFVPHQTAFLKAARKNLNSFNCGSPFITSAANTELIDVEWPEGQGPKIFLAFNPLPEGPEETSGIAVAVHELLKSKIYRCVAVRANTDRHNDTIDSAYIDANRLATKDNIPHQEYLSYLNDADVVIGNTSAGLIEGSYYGTPYVCVGSRQQYRVHGEHAIHRKPAEIEGAIREALNMGKRPNDSYGDKTSADKIAETLINEIEGG